MISLVWTPINTLVLPATNIEAPWIVAQHDLTGPMRYLRLKATGSWRAMVGMSPCGPDGLTGQAFPDDRLLVADCAVGALVGRIGGSSASLKGPAASTDAGESKAFPIGCSAVVKLPDNTAGPLFVSFNILLRPIALDSLRIEIESGT